MKSAPASILLAASWPLLALANAHNPQHHVVRQNLAASVPAGSSAASQTSGATPSVSLLPTPTGPTPSVSLASTNPTAVPLASIVVNAPSAATKVLPTPGAVGSKPSNIPTAPGLPDISRLAPASYPALDKPPPTDSPEVLQWIQDVKNSGVQIPGFAPTVAGGCPANTAAVSDASRCWWTCGGCTTATDITTCPDKYTWGLTYDDGPAPYTPDLLQYLDSAQLKSTFFVVGSRAISYPGILQQEYLAGHQIAVHTWSHPQLTTLTNEEIIAELGWSKKIIKDVLGVTPTMMRPPFGDIDNRVRAICQAMNVTPVLWTRISPLATFDTDDFNIHGGVTSVQQVLANWENILGNVSTINTGFIVLEHDLFQQSVEVATGYILPDALAHQPSFRIEPISSCLNLPAGDAYLETNSNNTNPLPLSATTAPSLPSGAPGSAQATPGSSGTTPGGGSTTPGSGAIALSGSVSSLLATGVAAGALFLFL